MYQIRTANLDAIRTTGMYHEMIEYYESKKQLHLDKKYVCYGDKLVSTKRIKVGFSFKFKFYFRNYCYLKPYFKWNRWDKCFHWLFFMFWFESIYDDVVDKVIKDHLSEQLEENRKLYLLPNEK